MAKKAYGSAKRYGTRYGRRLREKVTASEKEHRGKKKCPYCNKVQLRRRAAGIWECAKCNTTFAARAYSPHKTKIKTAEV